METQTEETLEETQVEILAGTREVTLEVKKAEVNLTQTDSTMTIAPFR
jgi:hypothetical protein